MRRVATTAIHVSQRWSGALLAASLLAAAQVEAAPAQSSKLPADPQLASLIEQSLAARPELSRAASEVQAERERVPQAGALPDPTLQLGVQNDGFTSWEVGKMESSYFSIMASQTFPWPGKLRLRSEVASLGADELAPTVTRARLSTEALVRGAWLALVLSRDRLALLDRLEELWQKSAAIARSRYETGQAAQSDVLRAQLELNRLRQRRWGLKAEAANAVQALNRLRGHPLDEAIEPAVHLAELAPPRLREGAELAQDALERSPELAAARVSTVRSEKSVALARKSYLPDLTVNLGIMPRGGDFPPMWTASVGIPLPVFAGSKQSRAVAESEARVAASQKAVEELEQRLRLLAEQRRTALEAALETVRLYQDGLLVQSEAAVDSTLAQYGVGKVGFTAVLEANAGFVADQDGYLQALAQVQRLEIDRAEVSLGDVGGIGAGVGGASAGMPDATPAGASPAAGPGPAAPTSQGSSSSMSSM